MKSSTSSARFAKKIAEYEEILGSDKKLRKVIVKELEDVRDKYGDERRTADRRRVRRNPA